VPPLSASVPYPWPFDAPADEALDGHRVALLCVAVQPSFASSTVGADVTTMTISLAARALRNTGARVVAVTVGASAGGRRAPVLAGHGEAPEPLIAASADAIVTTSGLDGFYGSPLEPLLRSWGRDRLVLCGLGAESAVDSTLRSANDRGFECLTLVDAVAPHDPALAARAHHSVTMSGGIFGAIGTTSDLLTAMGLGGAPVGRDPVLIPLDSQEAVSR
jgi:nicotinamidase-related amidase